MCDLRGEDLEVDAGEALEVLLEQALGVVLPDLLPRHGLTEAAELEEGREVGGSCGSVAMGTDG